MNRLADPRTTHSPLRLSLLRHGAAHSGPKDDYDRALTEAGKREIDRVAEQLRVLGEQPDRVLTSTAKRAFDSAHRLCRALGWPAATIEAFDELYLAPASALWLSLRTVTDTDRHVLMVGHNPGISEFYQQLTGDFASLAMNTGELRTVLPAIHSWRDLRALGTNAALSATSA
ncbi:MAG: histidine phosphatase family protein [Steroidobacteraceae bacterium]